ncbi:ybaK/ebsC protein [Roseburia intestinalis CAG:13]|nr:ybaK/ebsC protein [Roseburia intestinalis CAG:13]
MGKEVKTNAMRILDRNKIPYEIINYECDEFIDGLHTAEKTGAPVEQSFKTLVMSGKAAAGGDRQGLPPAGTDSIMFLSYRLRKKLI